MTAPITILGTGLAGYNLARELRKQDPDAPLRIISADSGDFYSKPMLSTGFASKKTANQLVMKPAEKMAEELKAELLTATRVLTIDVSQRCLYTDKGEFAYDKLVLALGADTFKPMLAGDAADTVLSVNDIADYAQFRHQVEGRQRIVLLGAGLIGCEFAHDLVVSGRQVTVIDLAGWPLSRLLPEQAGRYLQEKLAGLGVQFQLGAMATALDRHGEGLLLTLADGAQLAADLVMSAIGLQPRIALAKQAGLAVGRGILVDRYLQSSAPHIYALGDCAEVDGQLLPYVLPIMQAARALAASLTGKQTAVVYPAMPVVVKTPICPTVISPPAHGALGDWQFERRDNGLRALFTTPDDRLLGFALLGDATAERQALVTHLPAVLV
ncbi:NAD(P)/FAD-dependent oxidoreductase [Chitinimonas sp. BJB300]|uniref:NAD(P)/FAD-dependent oxidoreductase n=1 Tax=Chitinimonas sp. BJB300 TaxID=1559339 RepID=UPI000C0E7123|nr:FAD-dependent oxidoreductase [Chitinimonas sp. BJB300]PHV13329.1 FAD-dependent oxidoreductase [Chitinimonas sp. BJB300]TSJ85246.1 FAD-dependent oxidoreductase [Chitinimonas sp. BJB300]